MTRTPLSPEIISATLYLPNGSASEVPYTPSAADFKHMDLAIKEAGLAVSEGNPAVGAVVVSPSDVYSAHSTELSDRDLRNHAEMNAYGMAQPELGDDMSHTMWYTTVEPCHMCLGPIVQGEVGALYYAVARDDAPDFFRPRAIVLDQLLRDAGRTILVVSGIRREQSLKLLIGENKRHTSGQKKRSK